MSPSKVWTDRSRILTYRRCPRMRWIEYHAGGTGLVPARKSLALVVGGMVHEGLAEMLRRALDPVTLAFGVPAMEEAGVATGLAVWDRYVAENGGVEVESNERVWEAPGNDPRSANALDALDHGGHGHRDSSGSAAFNMPLGMDDLEIGALGVAMKPLTDRAAFEAYTQQEQRALLEGMLRAYARRRLRPLLEEYEVLEVEREGEWKLGEVKADSYLNSDANDFEVWFASRPDALLLHRESGALHLLSYKTTGGVDLRKLADIQHDDQGLSEGVEVEQRLREWWERVKEGPVKLHHGLTKRIATYLRGLPAPPRVDAIRYEFLLKGERWKDKGLSAQVGFEARSQKSPLVKGYQYSGRDPLLQGTWCWSWDYEKPDGSGKGSLNWQNWKATPVWQTYDVKGWIDLLDSGKAQQIGEAGDALAAQFYPPQIVYRSEDDLRDWVEQVEAQEQRVAEAVEVIEFCDVRYPGSQRSQLNILFPMNRSACEYPGRCAYADPEHGPCYGPSHARTAEAMLASGKYVWRTPNHPQEKSNG